MAMNSRDKAVDAIQRGREATNALAIVSPFINEMVSQTVQLMTNQYRAGEATPEFLLGKTAEISALFALISALEGIHRQGIAASQMEFGNAKN